MKYFRGTMMFAIFCTLLVTGCAVTSYAEPYDYSANIDCLPEPLPPQYGGGLIRNPAFETQDLRWSQFGDAKIESRKSFTGNSYLTVFDRTKATDSFVFWVDIKNDTVYTFSAWLQVDIGEETVAAFYTGVDNRSVTIGSVVAKADCWSFLKGGFTADEDVRAGFYFSTKNIDAELWVDSVSLKGFNKSEWEAHQNLTIDQHRKRTVRIHVVNRQQQGLPNASIALDQIRPKFLIGSGSPESILSSQPYRDYFASRFTAVTFHNEMKWYFTERSDGVENYTIPDAMLSFFKRHRIAIRGHTVLWADTHVTQPWVQQKEPEEDVLRVAVRRVGSVVSRYSGDIVGWDVMNENLHNSFYEERLGPNASALFFQITHALDPETPLFLNEYNVIEEPADFSVTASKYVAKVRETRAFPGNENLRVHIGVQGHFIRKPMVSYIRSVLDVLGATKMPIWITELDTRRGPLQASQLEEVMRETFSHPAVEGIIVWGGWKATNCNETCLSDGDYIHLPKGCSQMCLVDNDFKNLPAGDVVDKLLKEWKTTDVKGVTDANGVFEHKVFLGEYSVTFTHPSIPRSGRKTFNVSAGDGPLDISVFV